jgi:hypothetical protein
MEKATESTKLLSPSSVSGQAPLLASQILKSLIFLFLYKIVIVDIPCLAIVPPSYSQPITKIINQYASATYHLVQLDVPRFQPTFLRGKFLIPAWSAILAKSSDLSRGASPKADPSLGARTISPDTDTERHWFRL